MRNVLLAFCLACLASAANAATIDFEEFATPVSGKGSITSQGFTLTASAGSGYYGPVDYQIAGSAGYVSYSWCPDCGMTLADSSGDLFSIASATIGLKDSLFTSTTLTITGYLAGGGTVQKLVYGPVVPVPPQVVAFGSEWTNLERIEFTQAYDSGWPKSIDNIVVTAVPVPPALLLFGSAIAGLIGFRRRAGIR